MPIAAQLGARRKRQFSPDVAGAPWILAAQAGRKGGGGGVSHEPSLAQVSPALAHLLLT